MIHRECGKRSDWGGGGGCPRKMMSENRAQKFRSDDVSLPIPILGSDSDGLKLMFNKSEALPTSLFCCKACTGLCASVAGFEATLNEFSRLKANLILVLKFQIVT